MHISSVVPRVEVTLSVKIKFSYKDVEGILLYEDDQMAINLQILNCNVKRVLGILETQLMSFTGMFLKDFN